MRGNLFSNEKKGWYMMKKKIVFLLSVVMMTTAISIPAMAADYSFASGSGTWDGFGGSTSTDMPVIPDPMSANTRRNKDAAFLPPPYGVFSGDIPTSPSSPYHNNLPQSGFVPVSQELPPVGDEDYAPGSGIVSTGFLEPTSQTAALNTAPRYYEDGSIGLLYVERTGAVVKVYEGEDSANLAKGAGHFSSTSAWDGNVALAGHNRGGSGFFSFVKDLQSGDLLSYTTPYGSRTYKVVSKTQLSENDTSALSYSAGNILTLITCVADSPELRYCVVALEVKAEL
jgi:sortase A